MEYGFVGIDPGKTGSIALIDQQQNIVELFEMPMLDDRLDVSTIAGFLSCARQTYNLFIIIETPIAVGLNKGLAGTLINYGMLLGIMDLHILIKKECRANEWQKEICPPEFSKFSYTEGKKQKGLLAQRLFPKWKPKTVDEIKVHADSLLLALYCRKLVAKGLRSEFKNASYYFTGILYLKEEKTKGTLIKPNNNKAIMLNQPIKPTKKQIVKDFFNLDKE